MGAVAAAPQEKGDGGSRDVAPSDSASPSGPRYNPLDLSQEEIERRYHNERFLGMPVTQNQHNALLTATVGFGVAGAFGGALVAGMTEGATAGALGGPLGMAAGAVLWGVIGAGVGLIVGSGVGTQEDKAQGIPSLSPSAQDR